MNAQTPIKVWGECGENIVRGKGLAHCAACAKRKRSTSMFAGLTKAEIAVMRAPTVVGLEDE